MRLPFATDMFRFALPLAVVGGVALWWPGWPFAIPFLLLLAFVVWFFRDPTRTPPGDERVIVSAADGKVTDIDPDWAGDGDLPPGVRIGVFLSVFNVHVNRAPTSGQVEAIDYTTGKFLNALRASSATENENNLIRLRRGSHVIGVRQIAGAIARRILCSCKVGDNVARAQRIGLIRFGSRTEHYLPQGTEITIKVGQRVKGGETPIGLLPNPPEKGDN